MSALMLVHTSISATKTLRDGEESKRMVNKIEDAIEELKEDFAEATAPETEVPAAEPAVTETPAETPAAETGPTTEGVAPEKSDEE